MAPSVKAVAYLEGIRGTDIVPDGVATLTLVIAYVGLDPAIPITGDLFITGIPGGMNSGDIQKKISDAVIAELTSEHGYTFDPNDSVRILNIN